MHTVQLIYSSSLAIRNALKIAVDLFMLGKVENEENFLLIFCSIGPSNIH